MKSNAARATRVGSSDERGGVPDHEREQSYTLGRLGAAFWPLSDLAPLGCRGDASAHPTDTTQLARNTDLRQVNTTFRFVLVLRGVVEQHLAIQHKVPRLPTREVVTLLEQLATLGQHHPRVAPSTRARGRRWSLQASSSALPHRCRAVRTSVAPTRTLAVLG